MREAPASSGSTIEQWQSAYADLQQQQATADAELQQLREAAGSSGSSIEEWRNAYADLQQHYSSMQVSEPPVASAYTVVH
jgi:peptidoglycan hydrolase CwlO-like protein